jgi:uncharacterized protein DUF5990
MTSAAAQLPVRLVLVNPPANVAFGIQKGRGSKYETVQIQLGGDGDLEFDVALDLKIATKGAPNFVGPFAQGPAGDRFVYIGVGTFAGQTHSCWSRRIKVPLKGIGGSLVRDALSKPGRTLVARIPGTGRDGSPTCATVRLLGDWRVVNA